MATSTIKQSMAIVTTSISNIVCGDTPQTAGLVSLGGLIPTGYIPISVSIRTTNNDDYGAILIGCPVYRTLDNRWSLRIMATAAASVTVTGTMYISCVMQPQ